MIDLNALVAAASSVAEYPAARLIADALATELADASSLWPRLRMELANIARATASANRALDPEYAADLDGAAVDLKREHAREWWRQAKRARSRDGMVNAFRAFRREMANESFVDRLRGAR